MCSTCLYGKKNTLGKNQALKDILYCLVIFSSYPNQTNLAIMKSDSKTPSVPINKEYLNNLTYQIIGCAIEVHKHLGPGLLESTYEKCMIRELNIRGLNCKTQQRIPLHYKGINLDAELRYDVLVEDLVVVELKAIDGILPIHHAVVLTYMKMLAVPKGVIINFNCTNIYQNGQRTFVNDLFASLP